MDQQPPITLEYQRNLPDAPPVARIVDRLGSGGTSLFHLLSLAFVTWPFVMSLIAPFNWAAAKGGAGAFPLVLFALATASGNGTWEMQRLGLEYRDEASQPLRYWAAFRRILLGTLLLPLWPISLILMVMDERRRSLADRMCKTVVVKARRSRRLRSEM